MADNTTTYTTLVDVEVKGEKELDNLGNSAEETGDKFTRLQRQIRDTATAMQKAAETGDSVKFNALKGQLDELEDKLEITTLKSKQFDDALVAMPGPAGQAGQAIKMLDGGLKAMLANPVVATIAAIIGVFMLFKKSLESTSEGQETLNRISAAFGKILGPIMATIEAVALPLFEGLAWVLEKVGEGFAYVAKALGISDKKIQEASSGIKDFKKHNEDLAKVEKDAADKRAADAKKAAEDRKKAAAERKKDAEEAKKKAEEAKKQKIENAKSEIDLNEGLKESEDKLAQARRRNIDDRIAQMKQEQEFADENYAREKKRIEDLLKIEGLAASERKKLTADQNNLEAQYITDKQNRDRAIQDEQTKREQEAKDKALKDAEEKKKKDEEDKAKADEAAQKLLDAEMRARADKAALLIADYEYENTLKAQSFQSELDLFDKTRELERQNLAANKESADALLAFDKATAAQRIQIERAQQETKLAIISDALGTIADAVGRETAAGKALAIAQATINTYMGATKALATYPPPFGAIAAATVIVAGLLQVKKIISTKLPAMPKPGGGSASTSGGGASGGGPTITMPTMPTIPTLTAPGVTATGGTNPTQQIAGTLSAATNKPIKAYVVSGDVSSQQALDRRTSKAATF
jgi:hypothetical protein